LSVSRHIAQNGLISEDGQARTNGFQPLWVITALPAFAATTDRYKSLRLVLALHTVIFVLTAWLFGLVVRDSCGHGAGGGPFVFWAAVLLYGTAHLAFIEHFNGLETGLLLFLLILAWRRWQMRGMPESVWQSIVFGVLLGLCVLARIDQIFLVAIMLALVLRGHGSAPRRRIKLAAMMLLTSVAVSSPWWLYNWLYFGSLMPSSGRSQEEWAISGERVLYAGDALLQNLVPFLYFDRARVFNLVVRLSIVLAVAVLLQRNKSLFSHAALTPGGSRAMEFLFRVTVSVSILAFWYCLESSAYYFYCRYLAPLMLLPLFVLALLAARAAVRYRRLVCGGLAALAIAFCAYNMLLTTSFALERLYTFDQLALINRLVPATAKVGAMQSGAMGYLRGGALNLDGRVNNEALQYRGNLGSYLKLKGVVWFCDREDEVDEVLGGTQPPDWKFVAKQGIFLLYRRSSAALGAETSRERRAVATPVSP
jgi:hypothetical protein